jgi:hypothetical protein
LYEEIVLVESKLAALPITAPVDETSSSNSLHRERAAAAATPAADAGGDGVDTASQTSSAARTNMPSSSSNRRAWYEVSLSVVLLVCSLIQFSSLLVVVALLSRASISLTPYPLVS